MSETNSKAVITLRDWLQSSEGKAAMKRAAEEAAKKRTEIERLSEVSYEVLRKPMDF